MGYVFIDLERRVIEVLEDDRLESEMLTAVFGERTRWVYLGMQKDLHVVPGRAVSDSMISLASGESGAEEPPAPLPEAWVPAASDRDAMNWNYAVVEVDPTCHSPFQQTLNEMGAQGWELVHVHDHPLSGPTEGYLLFKRPMQAGGRTERRSEPRAHQTNNR